MLKLFKLLGNKRLFILLMGLILFIAVMGFTLGAENLLVLAGKIRQRHGWLRAIRVLQAR
ncbi:hypothetical protein HMSSN036_78570 [Paenibacillus macerans]|nr:hypothetical protein HMSSN036_78570 [Paenibacillus macerans]